MGVIRDEAMDAGGVLTSDGGCWLRGADRDIGLSLYTPAYASQIHPERRSPSLTLSSVFKIESSSRYGFEVDVRVSEESQEWPELIIDVGCYHLGYVMHVRNDNLKTDGQETGVETI
ncbi:unnamed protein product [Cyclocybe aegerita]|uniref:Uncharacterized protein n=1 Tax=Cyclocybe aegerita TaxID=1973307 RepID=A0A8S0X5K3_CYCAE|nr:unnamed protein product [Cyclocybe aegerita]